MTLYCSSVFTRVGLHSEAGIVLLLVTPLWTDCRVTRSNSDSYVAATVCYALSWDFVRVHLSHFS